MIKKILYLSPTYEGRIHDKTICDEEQIEFDLPVGLWVDLGFIGLMPDNADVKIPVKKPKKENYLPKKRLLTDRCQANG